MSTSVIIVALVALRALQAVAVGCVINVIQDSVETALNSSDDVFFTATAEEYDRKKKGKSDNSAL